MRPIKGSKKLNVGLLAWLFLTVVATSVSATTLYVKSGAGGDGTSWSNAFDTLQQALDVAVSGDQIWVAAGTYKPTSDYGLGGGDRYKHFRMKDGVSIYGGFPATGTPTMGNRNRVTNATILNGDLNGSGTLNDGDAYHVFYHPSGTGLSSTAVLDGFTVTGGYANGSVPHKSGAGMYNDSSSPTITNCTFSGNTVDNDGGGMSNSNGSNPTITNCTFSGNYAGYAGCGIYVGNGGGMYNNGTNPTITNCTFSGNSTMSSGAGMVNAYAASPVLVNCVFSGNSAAGWPGGGGIYNAHSSNPTLTNCTLSGNNAVTNYGGGMINYNGCSPTLTNCIIWGNSASVSGNQIYLASGDTATLHYCCYANGTNDMGGTGFTINNGITTDPQFVDPKTTSLAPTTDGDYHILPGSEAIDAGNNAAVPAGVTIDLDGNPRIVDGNGDGTATVDMGAYEYPGSPKGDINGDSSRNISDVILCLRMSLSLPVTIDGQTTNPPYTLDLMDAADINSDAIVNISDVILCLGLSLQ